MSTVPERRDRTTLKLGRQACRVLAYLRPSAPPAIFLIFVLVLWQGVIEIFHVSPYMIPAPTAIAASLIDQFHLLMAAALVTGKEVLVGFLLAAIVGVALALIIARFNLLGRAIYPLVVLFQTVPKVALAPIFILWFGYDLAPKVALIVVIAFFPVSLDMLAGLQSVERGFVALMRSVGASETQILLRVRLPYALPHLMSGLKVAITFSVIGAIVGEFAGASAGLGYMIQFASTQLDTALVFAALTIVSALGAICYYAVELIEKVVIPWAPRFDAAHKS